MTMPTCDVAVRLTGPERRSVGVGPSDPEPVNSVSGPALDFCLVVTQRRHLPTRASSVVGDAAGEWMSIAQAFAGGVRRRPAARSVHRSVISLKTSAAA